MSRFDKSDISPDGKNAVHTRFVPTDGYYAGRKVVAVERADKSVEVRYDQGRQLEGKRYRNMQEFERGCR